MIMDINELSSKVIDAAIEVHKSLGPGLLESAFEFQCARYAGWYSASCKRIKGMTSGGWVFLFSALSAESKKSNPLRSPIGSEPQGRRLRLCGELLRFL